MLQSAEFKQQLHECSLAVAEILTEENYQNDQLLSSKARKEKIAYEIDHQIEAGSNKILHGLKIIIESFKEINDLPVSREEVVDELENCLSFINSFEDFKGIGEAALSEVSVKSYLKISNTCMEMLYRGAKYLFEKGKFDQSEDAFFVLCFLDPTQFVYWIGRGHSCFHQKNYQQAIDAYAMASALEPTNFWPHIWAANCFEEENNYQYAKMALQEALNLQKEDASPNPELIRSIEERIRKF